MQNSGYFLRLYSIYPEPREARKKVTGNQGTADARRFTMLPSDFDRISTYQAKGDLASYDEFFEYISNRDAVR
jgi:hypothetical protein